MLPEVLFSTGEFSPVASYVTARDLHSMKYKTEKENKKNKTEKEHEMAGLDSCSFPECHPMVERFKGQCQVKLRTMLPLDVVLRWRRIKGKWIMYSALLSPLSSLEIELCQNMLSMLVMRKTER